MKLSKMAMLLFILSLAVSCASPGVSKRFDEFAGGEVVELGSNQLDTPGIGDIYFNAKGMKQKDGHVKVDVTGVLDYEYQSLEPIFDIDKVKDLALLVDGQNVYLKSVPETYHHNRMMGAMNPLHVISLNYQASLEDLKKIAAAKVVKMKIYTKNHKDGGIVGNFTPENFLQLNNFIKSLE